jgi:hypothetical protein
VPASRSFLSTAGSLFTSALSTKGRFLAGQKIAACLSSPITGSKIYFSRFDMPFGRGRIHSEAPLDLFREVRMKAGKMVDLHTDAWLCATRRVPNAN